MCLCLRRCSLVRACRIDGNFVAIETVNFKYIEKQRAIVTRDSFLTLRTTPPAFRSMDERKKLYSTCRHLKKHISIRRLCYA